MDQRVVRTLARPPVTAAAANEIFQADQQVNHLFTVMNKNSEHDLGPRQSSSCVCELRSQVTPVPAFPTPASDGTRAAETQITPGIWRRSGSVQRGPRSGQPTSRPADAPTCAHCRGGR